MMRLGLLVLASVGLLVGVYQYARWSRRANPAQAARLLRWTGIVVGLMLLLVLMARSGSALTVPLLGALIPALWRWRVLWGGVLVGLGAKPEQHGGGSTASSSSRVETLYLCMVLDHATGELKGTVLRGCFKDVELARLQLRDLLELYEECQPDPQSVAVLEAYLDHVHKGAWRQHHAGRQQESASGVVMDRREAYEILGLRPGASLQEIKAAHRRLMQRVHPDQGGSNYLAAKINRAKDLLLGKQV